MVPENIHMYPLQAGLLDISWRREVTKAKILKGKCEPQLEFPKGWRGWGQTKKPSREGHKYFLEQSMNIILY